MNNGKLDILPEALSHPHDSAHLHVAGESIYVDDKPLAKDELLVGLVVSPHALARIVSVTWDIDDAMVFTAKDIHHNWWGPILPDQPLIADNEVNYVGEVVAVVYAKSPQCLKNAIAAVKVEYEVLKPILSIDTAIEQKQFIGHERQIKRGDAEDALTVARHRLSGSFDLGGADHFYLENQSVIAYPENGGRITIHASTQHPTETQTLVAESLGLLFSDVVCVAERLGGGFGGKETQAAPFAVYAALVAHKTKQPARLVLSKDDDMLITGKRNPYRVHYDVGFNDDGEINALDCRFYGDGGAYADLSTAILERAMAHVDNAYFLRNVTIRGIVCRTNFHPHTAFRGFGGPKGVALIEHVMEDIAFYLKRDSLDIRMRNCYRGDRNTTPYGQVVENNLLPALFETLAKQCDYRQRRIELDQWNSDKTKNPRGMSLTAIKFGICFTARFFNQGHALVHVFRDGSVQVATGAVEMGQGVQARIKALVADCFGIAHERVRVLATATDKSANTSPTAASSGTDLNGSAAVKACEEIRDHLSRLAAHLFEINPDRWPQKTAGLGIEPEIEYTKLAEAHAIFLAEQVYFAHSPERSISFTDLVNAAYLSRIPLSAYGFYKVPGVSFNRVSGEGNPFLYFTQGTACSEVEIDRSTGQIKVVRTDILMDAGNPINFALDKGQIAGAFIQGLGYVTSEKLFYNEHGKLLSHSPSTYKIPSIHDTPRIFNIHLVHNNENTKNLRGTKALGEPPLMLCFSVWNAIKDALSYNQGDCPRIPALPVPASAEAVLMQLTRRNE